MVRHNLPDTLLQRLQQQPGRDFRVLLFGQNGLFQQGCGGSQRIVFFCTAMNVTTFCKFYTTGPRKLAACNTSGLITRTGSPAANARIFSTTPA